jgi:hypothetical protein
MPYERVSPGIYRNTQTGQTMRSPTMPQPKAMPQFKPMPKPIMGQPQQIQPGQSLPGMVPQGGGFGQPQMIGAAIDNLKGPQGSFGAGIDPGFNMGPGPGYKPGQVGIMPYPMPKPTMGQPMAEVGQIMPTQGAWPMSGWKTL